MARAAQERPPIAFPKLSAAQLAALGGCAARVSFRPAERLFSAGERGVPFFVIERGEVQVVDTSSGRDETIVVLEAGEFTGDVNLLTGRPALVSAIARTSCEVCRVPADDLRRIIVQQPQLGDVLLKAFLVRRQLLEQSGVAALRVIGSRFCRDTHRIREFLARNKVPFAWIDLESDADVNALLGRFGIGAGDTPVVICASGEMLRAPSNAELAASLGIRKPIEHKFYDLAIVGAGPAGLAAAVYAASEGLQTVVLDRTGPGGQASASSLIENYMGFPAGLSGSDLADRAVVQAHKFGATLSVPVEVMQLACDGGHHLLGLDGGGQIAAKCVLIGAGASYRKLDAGDCARFESFGLNYAATRVEAQLCERAQAVVVGGGNSAGQAAVFLSGHASKVLLIIRGGDLRKNMSDYLARRIERTPGIEVRFHTEIDRLHGGRWLEAVDVRSLRTGVAERIDCAALFVFIGAVPHTAWLSGTVQLDGDGFVATGPQLAQTGAWPLGRRPSLLETSCPGVFAAGDARLGSIKRVASAVGEGAMAVQFVHGYLASA